MSDTKEPQGLQRWTLLPQTLGEAREIANLIASSDFAPKDYKGKPGNVIVAIQMGADVGLKPMQALQNIAVINGRPSVWGDAALALVQASGIVEKFHEYFEGEKGTDSWTAVCEMKRKDWPDLIVRKFSVGDAKKAGLWMKRGKEGQATPWVTYEDRMLQMRARGFTIRDGGSDVLMGLILAEEAQDYPAADVIDVSPSSGQSALPPVNLLDRLPEGLRDNIEKAFSTLELAPGLRIAKMNEFMGGADVVPEEGAEKLLLWCRDEYAKRKTGHPIKRDVPDNGKKSKVEAASEPTAAGPVHTPGPTVAASDSLGTAVGSVADTRPPSGDQTAVLF